MGLGQGLAAGDLFAADAVGGGVNLPQDDVKALHFGLGGVKLGDHEGAEGYPSPAAFFHVPNDLVLAGIDPRESCVDPVADDEVAVAIGDLGGGVEVGFADQGVALDGHCLVLRGLDCPQLRKAYYGICPPSTIKSPIGELVSRGPFSGARFNPPGPCS